MLRTSLARQENCFRQTAIEKLLSANLSKKACSTSKPIQIGHLDRFNFLLNHFGQILKQYLIIVV